MRSVCFALICCLTALFTATPTAAENIVAISGKCAVPGLKSAFQNASAVFTGEVLSVTKKGDEKTFEFRIRSYWKGVTGKKVKISVLETTRFQAWFQPGESYLVFARAGEDGRLRDGRCSASKLLSEASKDLRELGRAKIPR